MAEKKTAASKAATKGKQKSDSQKAENQAENLSAVVDLPKGYTELNVREKPNGKILRTLKRGESVEVFGVEPVKDGAGENWSKLLWDGGFVKTEFLKFE